MKPTFKGLTSEEVEQIKKSSPELNLNSKNDKTLSDIFLTNTFTLFNGVNITVIISLLYFYFKSADHRLLYDSLGIITITLFNTTSAILQEYKALDKIKDIELLSKTGSTVVRNGEFVTLPEEQIVKGDIVFFKSGDQIMADGIIVESSYLEIDESILTHNLCFVMQLLRI